MIRQLIFLFVIAVNSVGCSYIGENVSEHAKKTIDDGIEESKIYMASEIINSKMGLTETYRKAIEESADSTAIKKVTKLHSSINETSNYMDSLSTEMNKLDNDPKNNDLVKNIFIKDGIGDSIFNKVKLCYRLAIEIALADTTKSQLRKAQGLYTNETKNQFFGLNSPGGVHMILYGIESELIKDGTKSLYGYSAK